MALRIKGKDVGLTGLKRVDCYTLCASQYNCVISCGQVTCLEGNLENLHNNICTRIVGMTH